MLAAKGKFKRAAVNDPAFTFYPLPPGACRLVEPEPAGLLGLTAAAAQPSVAVAQPSVAVPSLAELTTLPYRKSVPVFDDRVAAHAAGQDRRGGGAGVASGRAAERPPWMPPRVWPPVPLNPLHMQPTPRSGLGSVGSLSGGAGGYAMGPSKLLVRLPGLLPG